MPRINGGLRLGIAAACVLLVAAEAPKVAPTTLRALDGLQLGEWSLRDREPGSVPRRICVSDARQLLQTEHGQAQCRRFVVTDAPQNVVVTYDCGAAGSGRTDLRVETARLAQIQSQGIFGGAPFSRALEARWVGPSCR